jgi:phosphoribosyl 1,2-cyclic phosphodiesterase
MKLWVLGSGSSGNAAVVSCGDEHIVLDAGFGVRTLAARLTLAGVDPKAVTACVLTHEHSDHIHGAARAARRWGWPVYATAGSAASRSLSGTTVTRIVPGATIHFDQVSVETVATPHDAIESIGFVITARTTGARLAVFYDIGHVSDAIRTACHDVDMLLFESNHDDHMLRHGPYPRWLQARIASDVGHLSNRCAADLIGDSVHESLRHVVLAHISQHCNTPAVALAATRAALRRARYRGALTAAPQDGVVGPFQPRGSRAERAAQLSFF